MNSNYLPEISTANGKRYRYEVIDRAGPEGWAGRGVVP